MSPVESLKRGHLFARIDQDAFTVDCDQDYSVVELVHIHVGNIENPLIARDHLLCISGQPRGAYHGQVQKRDVFTAATFLLPRVFGVLGLFQIQLLQLRLALLARVVRVVQGLHCLVNLLRPHQLAVARSNQPRHRFTNGLGLLGKPIRVF